MHHWHRDNQCVLDYEEANSFHCKKKGKKKKMETEKQIMCFYFISSKLGLRFFSSPFGVLKQNKNSLLHKHKTKYLLNKHFKFTPMHSVLTPIGLQELGRFHRNIFLFSGKLIRWVLSKSSAIMCSLYFTCWKMQHRTQYMPVHPDIQIKTTNYKQFQQIDSSAFVPQTYIFLLLTKAAYTNHEGCYSQYWERKLLKPGFPAFSPSQELWGL